MSWTARSFIRPVKTKTAAAVAPLVRLLCLPYAGAGASVYRSWPERFPPWIEVAAVQLPGREDRWSEPPLDSIPRFLEGIAGEIDRYLDLPVAIFGHSLGGLLGFELGCLLRRHFGVSPLDLIVSAAPSPAKTPARWKSLHRLPDDDFLAEISKLEGVPGYVLENRELVEAVLPALRADVALYETYRFAPRAPLGCPILAVGGHRDALVTAADLLGWRLHTLGHWDVRLFPGDHFYLHSSRDKLLRLIASRLAAALCPGPRIWG